MASGDSGHTGSGMKPLLRGCSRSLSSPTRTPSTWTITSNEISSLNTTSYLETYISLEGVPELHGYNDVEAKKKGTVLAVNSENGAPILVVGKHRAGRVVAFASNSAGGWGMDFVEWTWFDAFIQGMAAWSTGLN